METPRLLSPLPSTLSADINTATRLVHTSLNRLITARLPLALPPHTSQPVLYAHGINSFAPVYYAFEAAWKELKTNARVPANATKHDMDVRGWLCELVPDGLWRTERLEKDLSHLDKAHALHLNDIKARGEATEKFVRHIRTAIQDKPHRLVAYSWVMYMAIFSGGRWIRQQLLDAQADFWHGQAESSRAWRVDSPLRSRAESGRITKTGMPGFSFLYFDSEADGEDIKADFKERLAAAEALLTPAERKDVVEEAQTIFEYCVSVVEELDRRLDTASGLGNQEPADGHAVRGKRPTSHPVQLTKRRIVDWQTRALQPLAALLAVFVGCLTWYVLL